MEQNVKLEETNTGRRATRCWRQLARHNWLHTSGWLVTICWWQMVTTWLAGDTWLSIL